ncbi:MAG: GNAT family N-acetyltransferase [Pseudobdellovibrionaceae bacterium]
MDIVFLPAKETHDLRHSVLRPAQPRSSVLYVGDDAETSFHLGIKFENQIIAVSTYHLESSPLFPNTERAYRLRGMAVEPLFRRQKMAERMFLFAEQELKHRDCDLLWFHARESAFPFYEKIQCHYASDMFEIEGIGPHKTMYKRILSR